MSDEEHDEREIVIRYRNYRGEISDRRILPERI